MTEARLFPGATAAFLPGGRPYRVPAAPWRVVLHTTETGNRLPSYRRVRDDGSMYYVPPHITVRRPSQPGGPEVWQHRPHDISASSLVHLPGDPETNHARALQVEVLGFASEAAGWPPSDYAFLASVVAFYCREFGVGIAYPQPFGSAAYGPGSPARMAWDAWALYPAVCGHQHVPGNRHWDPGPIRAGELMALISLAVIIGGRDYVDADGWPQFARASIAKVIEAELMIGDERPNGSGEWFFDPADAVTRAQLAVILDRIGHV